MFDFIKKDVLDENAKLRAMLGEKEAEVIKAHSENRRYESLIAAIAAPMYVVNKDLVISSINDVALNAMGYSRDEVVGKMTCAQLSKTPLCGTSNCTLKNCMRTGETIYGETVAETRSGQKLPIRAACSPLMDENGKPYGGIEVIVDISEVKQLQREADEQRKYLEGQITMLVDAMDKV